jgi:PleD family two-component response regulator
MTKPLAILVYENLMPGSQLVNRLQDLGYRVLTLSEPRMLQEAAARERPLIVITDLASQASHVAIEIKGLKINPTTSHIPVIAFSNQERADLQNAAKNAGADLVASDTAVLNHLAQLLDQALQID